MYPFDYVPFLDPTVLGPPIAAVFGAYGAIKLGPPIVRRARQRAYDEACAADAVRLVVAPTAGMLADSGAAAALIRALHPHQRRGLDAWRVGWPSLELRVVWRGGALAWELIAGRQVATGARHALAARYPGVHIDEAPVGERPAAATAVGRLTASSRWPLREPEAGDAGALHGLAAALAAERPSAEVRLRLVARPVPPDAWRREVAPEPRDHSIGIGRLVGHAIVEGLMFHPESTLPEPDTPRTLTPDERVAAQRRRAGMVGFDVGLVLEVADAPPDAAEALLWRLVDFTHPLADPHQAIGWTIRRGAVGNPPRARLTDWETALLWYLPDASFDGLGVGRSRPLAPASAGRVADEEPVIVIGCLYTLRHLANDDVQAFGAGDWVPNQNASIKRIAELKRRLPDLVLVPGHDHTPYQFEHLVPGLAKGHLTAEERVAIRDYERAVFTPGGRLRPEATPSFIPGKPPDYVGQVSPAPPDR
jgi:hypothetical protein